MFWTSALLCASSAHISLLLCLESDDPFVSILKKATIVFAISLDIYDVLVFFGVKFIKEIDFVLILFIGAAMVIGTIITPIITLATKKSNKTEKKEVYNDIYQKLELFKKMKDNNVITEEE